jgi:hypothetical protein
MVNPNLITPEAAACYLGVTYARLRKLQLPVVIVGNEPRFLVADLDTYIKARRLVPQREAAAR